ncbi:sensor histidine kinase [Amycolatopsis pithecellobii]|uniref:sensor histidine kinase n=1 Tax=Amycolatopsis pithecellobii TaxID=664692 RepID=UPI00140C5157|nr:sensor histidine kinase [Amycolatopsis pithecellobii]
MTVVENPWQARLDRLRRTAPLPLLAVSTAVSFVTPENRPTVGEAVLVVAAAVWALLIGTRKQQDLPWQVSALAVHTGLAAILVGTDPAFGIFAYTGFLFAYPLAKPWRLVGFAATALIVSASISGGYPSAFSGRGLTYLLVAAVVLVLMFHSAGITSHALARDDERGRIVAENTRLQEQLVTQVRDAGIVEERQRIAGEVHDTLAQGLTGIIAQLAAADHVRDDREQLRRHLDLARSLARASLTEARRSVRALRPEQLEGANLPAEIGTLAREWTEQAGVPAQLSTTGRPLRAAAGIQDVLFRVAQEALANVAKHAQAEQVMITLTFLDDTLLLDVHDDGHGFDPGAPTDGYGLAGMRKRLAGVGGVLTIESEPGDGVTVNAAVPLR